MNFKIRYIANQEEKAQDVKSEHDKNHKGNVSSKHDLS